MIRVRQPGQLTLQRVLEQQSSSSVTYSGEGATRAEMPSDFKHDEVSVAIGKGRRLFEACGDYLEHWGLQRAMGFTVYPIGNAVRPGRTVLLALPIFGFTLVASCRVIYSVSEANRRGFAYGTLPMHPECGEEYFGVHIDNTNAVYFELRAFSKPHSRLARLSGPIVKRMQAKATYRYGEEMRAFAVSIGDGSE